ncbi:dephospho-CoA kinase [Pararobbsia silviterrae]|uniref:Dephospho-CoA kinase n=1 Tax=Pararobbsia silviterrae TaxID=1792498 RepID=A0A494XKC5_9BURK|nr:dephospho-CoA kinase [Pararobbsia silviterrae]RKP48524.1 dephospho-CoA kinase [Pararobbsia silviterrae]
MNTVSEPTHARAAFSVGLTGGIGSGKTLVANRLAELGASVIDTDVLAHAITAPGGSAMPAIEATFGADFVTAEGALDRARMRALVFSDDSARRKLEAITHPLIRTACESAAHAATGLYRVFVVPLLVESGSWRSRVNRILVVDCDVETQIRRVMARNGFAREQVQSIIDRQATRAQRLAVADDVIENDHASPGAVLEAVDALHTRYLALSAAA